MPRWSNNIWKLWSLIRSEKPNVWPFDFWVKISLILCKWHYVISIWFDKVKFRFFKRGSIVLLKLWNINFWFWIYSISNLRHCISSWVFWLITCIYLHFIINSCIFLFLFTHQLMFKINWVSLELLRIIIHLFYWSTKIYFVPNVVLDIYFIPLKTSLCASRICSFWDCSQSTIVIWSISSNILTSIHERANLFGIGFFILLNHRLLLISAGGRFFFLSGRVEIFSFYWIRIVGLDISIKW